MRKSKRRAPLAILEEFEWGDVREFRVEGELVFKMAHCPRCGGAKEAYTWEGTCVPAGHKSDCDLIARIVELREKKRVREERDCRTNRDVR